MDWEKWHDKYKVSPALIERLNIVRNHISKCLDLLPAGQIKIISVCAGDGRDLLGLMENHPRKNDIVAFLSENNSELVDSGSNTIIEAGLEKQIKLSLSDATFASTYNNYTPADIVIFAGVFGNVRIEETPRIISNMCALVKTSGFIIWTRHCRHNNGPKHIEIIRNKFSENNFEEIGFEQTTDGTFGIGTNKYLGSNHKITQEVKLFEFIGFDKL